MTAIVTMGEGVGSGRPPRSLVGAAVVLTVAGLLVGRVISHSDTPATRTPAAAPAASVLSTSADDVPALETRVAAVPDDLNALRRLSVAYVRRAVAGDVRSYELAQRALTRAQRLAPGDPQTNVALATLQLSLHHFDVALRIATELERAHPGLNDTMLVLVDANVELGHYDDAGRWLQRLVDRRPGLPVYSRVAYFRELHGDLEGAAQAMQLAVSAGTATTSDVAVVTALLGDVEYARGDANAADAHYVEAATALPELTGAAVGHARVLAQRGHVADAIRTLQTFTNRVPQPAALMLLGDLQRASGDLDAAAATDRLVRSVAQLQEAGGQVTDLEMAQWFLDHDAVSAGAQRAEAVARARPDNVFAADVLAWARYRQGAFADARALAERALRLGTTDRGIRGHAAAIFAAAGDTGRARALLASVVAAGTPVSFATAVQHEFATLRHDLGV